MAKHAMFRADNLAGTTQGKYLASVRLAEDLDNGSVVVIGDYEAGAREVRTYTAPTAESKLGKIAILGSEEVNTDVKYDTVGGFTNRKGTIGRGYILEEVDVFSVTAEAFTTVPAKGDTVYAVAGSHKMSKTGDVALGVCEAIELDGATTWYVVRV